jgi:hypothetical protein
LGRKLQTKKIRLSAGTLGDSGISFDLAVRAWRADSSGNTLDLSTEAISSMFAVRLNGRSDNRLFFLIKPFEGPKKVSLSTPVKIGML